MLAKCRTHLAEAGETYLVHMRFASGVALMLIGAGVACLLHALIPALCEKTASRTVGHLSTVFVSREGLPEALEETSGVVTLVGLLALSTPAWVLAVATPHQPMTAVAAALSLAVAAAYLWTNPQLEPVS